VWSRAWPPTEELAQRPAIRRALEEAQPADLTNREAAIGGKDFRGMNTQSRVLRQRLADVGPERNNTTPHTAEIAVASHRAAEIR